MNYTRRRLVALLAPVVEASEADRLIAAELRLLGSFSDECSASTAIAALQRIGARGGPTGLAAQRARLQIASEQLAHRGVDAQAGAANWGADETTDVLLDVGYLEELLSPALGAQLSRREIERAAQELALHGGLLRRDDATRLLAHLSARPGLVGVASRLAQSRWLRGRQAG